MNEDVIEGLQGRCVQRSDTVDPHRWNCYHGFFDLVPGQDLPLALHWLLFNDLPREVRPDGHPVQMVPFPVLPFPRRMWAGGEINWLAPLSTGMQLRKSTTVASAEIKSGGSGRFMLASLQHLLEAESTRCVDERQNIVFLPAESRPGSGTPRPSPFDPAWSEPCSFGTVHLFRYSALTLNSHRIHYDEPYTRTVEGYPALVVHGPLLATRLMQTAARHRAGEIPARYTYRSVAPVFVEESITLVGRTLQGAEELAVLGPDGSLRVTATMSFRE